MANSYPFYTCDVFTNTQFTGNPLAVLPHADGLTSEQMQHIAREFNYSETAFVFNQPVLTPQFTRQVRIFTPNQELPFAGHPNIGTAFTLAQLGMLGDLTHATADNPMQLCFVEKAGDVPMQIYQQHNHTWAQLKAPQPLEIGQTVDVALVAAALSIAMVDIETSTHLPQVASVGLACVIVAVKNPRVLTHIHCDIAGFKQLQLAVGVADIYVYCQSTDGVKINARMFAPLNGTVEDPATGSAACALVALLTAVDTSKQGKFNWRIHQGVEMGRPSELVLFSEKRANEVIGVHLAGTCKQISQGTIDVD